MYDGQRQFGLVGVCMCVCVSYDDEMELGKMYTRWQHLSLLQLMRHSLGSQAPALPMARYELTGTCRQAHRTGRHSSARRLRRRQI